MTQPMITMRAVSAMAGQEFGVTLGVMKSASRVGVVARARQVAMYLCVSELGKTLPEAGRFFDGKDHTTVLHAVRKVAALIETDATFAARIERLREQIRAAEAGIVPPPMQVPATDAELPSSSASLLIQPVQVPVVPASVGRLTQAVDDYLKARRRLEGDCFSAHEAPSRRVEEQALSGLRIAYHDYLAGGQAS